jgi:hypothetical protein
LPDAFYVRVGFALGGRRPPHKILVSLLKQSTSARIILTGGASRANLAPHREMRTKGAPAKTSSVEAAAVVPLPRRWVLTACMRGEVPPPVKSLIDARPARACRASRFARAALHDSRGKR